MGTTTSNIINVRITYSKSLTDDESTLGGNYDKNISFNSYKNNELLSLGKYADFYSISDEFEIIKKASNYVDAYRTSYNGDTNTCCTTDLSTYLNNNKLYTCDPLTKNFDSNVCDIHMSPICVTNNNLFYKCDEWISGNIKRNNSDVINSLQTLCKNENNRNCEACQTFLTYLRLYSNNNNIFNSIADSIIDSYSNNVKYLEYPCVYVSKKIDDIDKQNLNLIKECWYEECIKAPIYKLKTQNIINKSFCNINICDIDIKNLIIMDNNNKISNIECYKKITDNSINIKNIPFIKDKNLPFLSFNYSNILILSIPLFFLYL